jgi:hypothetical protein
MTNETQTTHTDGPWGLSPVFDQNVYAADGISVALVMGDAADPEVVANARLIAAAPDLLEVCDYITALSAGWDEDGSLGPREPLSWETVARMAMDVARYAALKARGVS